MPGTALWVDGFICLPLSPFIFLPLSPSLDAWHGSGRVHFVSLCLPSFFFVVSQPGCLALFGWTGSFCLPLAPSMCLPLSRSLDAWHGSLSGRVHLSLCLPSFGPREPCKASGLGDNGRETTANEPVHPPESRARHPGWVRVIESRYLSGLGTTCYFA